MKSTPRKTGRPVAYHELADGTRVDGVYRLGDGRWRCSGPERYTFSEPDERLAVMQFRAWQAKRSKAKLAIPSAVTGIHDPESVRRAVASFPEPAANPANLRGTFLPPDAPDAPSLPGDGELIRLELDGDHLLFYGNRVDEDALWLRVRRQLIDRPQYVAERVGIEPVGYLASLSKPVPSPTLEAVGKLYLDGPR